MRFILQTIVFSFIFAGAIVAFGYITDPFGVWKSGFLKPSQYFRIDPRQLQPLVLTANQFDLVILGSSRAREGFDPNDRPDVKGYNAAFSGASIYETGKMMSLLSSKNFHGSVLVGLDFFCSAADMKLQGISQEGPLAGKPLWLFRLKTLWGWKSVSADLHNIRVNIFGKAKSGLKNFHGSYEGGNYPARFKDGLDTHATDFLSRFDPDKPDPDLEIIATLKHGILDLASKGNKVTLIINPSHASRLLLNEKYGLGENYNRFFRSAIQMVNEIDAIYPGLVTLWDFSICTPVLAEKLPATPEGKMTYFYDSNHFTPAFGKLIMEQALDGKASPVYQGRLLAPHARETVPFSRDWVTCERLLDEPLLNMVENARKLRKIPVD